MENDKPLCLIVDDDPDTCWALERVLRRHGLRSDRAPDGQSAVGRVRQVHYALALLDAKLPDTDGLELAEQLRCMDPGLRMILISGYFYEDDATVRQAQAKGLIENFIGKPFLHQELMTAVGQILARGENPET